MNNKGYLLAITAGIIWGTLGLGTLNLSNFKLNSSEIAFIRVSFAFILGMIYIFIIKRDKLKPSYFNKGLIVKIIFSGVLSQGLLNILYANSVIRVGTITGIMLLATGTLFTILLSKIFFKEKLGIIKIISLITAFLGTFILVTEGNLGVLKFDYIGIVYGILSELSYGLFPIFNKKIIETLDPIVATTLTFGIAAIFLSFFIDKILFIKIFTNIEIFKSCIFYALVPTLIPYLLYSLSMKFIPPSTAGIISLLEIPSAALIGVFLLDERIGFIKGIGILIVLLGIIISKISYKKV